MGAFTLIFLAVGLKARSFHHKFEEFKFYALANTSTSTKQTSSSDLQVIIHEGGPRVTQKYPEAVWVSITACENNVFQGRVLNVPSQLDSIKQNDIISFLANTGGQYAVMTTAKYLRERPQWKIHPCSKCGFSELFDAPSDLVRATFPSLSDDALIDAFTTFCPLCDGTPVVEPLRSLRWWQFAAGRQSGENEGGNADKY